MGDSIMRVMTTGKSFIIRRASEGDCEPAAQIIQDSFGDFWASVGQPEIALPPRDEDDIAKQMVTFKAQHPNAIVFVAMAVDGEGNESEMIGTNGIDLRDGIGGIGVLSVATKNHGRGVGRALMEVVMESSEKRGGRGVSLTVNAANVRAFSLYASLGFRVVEFCVDVEGRVSDEEEAAILDRAAAQGLTVREMVADDVPLCDRLFAKSFGFSRINGLRDSQAGRDGFQGKTALVVTRRSASGGDEIVGYTTLISITGHYLAESEDVMQTMVAYGSRMLKSTSKPAKASLRVMTHHNPALLMWAMKAGLRVKSHWLWMYRGEPFQLDKKLAYCPDWYY
ncbi:unnamed protein product [Ostreobium quekettii]|uniref:N-acetyltransferase domain-containing protein n=1 Tax=Ostreobium quekettii TaxID=121088 RepID=A0A8S1IXM3_9CHLO|nr:unnamed protein product [Ostreobium quekettii]|eukprot:evm.model.scf_329EXC.8 EVM.evm.TU.scf_329EXC.8   scf_329EXC:92673-93686(+)